MNWCLLNNKRNDGARASAALVHLHQGPRPLDPFRRYCKFGRKDYFRQFRWGYEKLVGFWPKKVWEKCPGESELSPGHFSQTFPGCFASGMATLSAGSIVASPHSGHCSFRLISPPMKFPPQAVIGGSSGPEAITSPSRAYFQSTACVCFFRQTRQHPPMRGPGGSSPWSGLG